MAADILTVLQLKKPHGCGKTTNSRRNFKMRINHNIAALNTHRQLTGANNMQAKSMEKLSSGLRINRAGDDAAGLAISEKMRGQIRGLEQAQRNAQDGISLIQTTEGALNESHSILQRMRELSVQSANDTNTATDRSELQKEVDQLSQELSRIGNTTEFNTQNLLDGSFKGTFHIGANEGQNLELSVNDMRGFALNMTGDVVSDVETTETVSYTPALNDNFTSGDYKVEDDGAGGFNLVDSNGATVATSTDGKTFDAPDTEATPDGEFDSFTLTNAVGAGASISIDTAEQTVTASTELVNSGLEAGDYTVEDDGAGGFNLLSSNGETVATSTDGVSFVNSEGTEVLNGGGAVLADGDSLSVKGIDISSQENASSAVTTINNAIETVSAERSKLGAFQNRLEHTINNLGTSAENLTAAESRIRDVDMAREMMEQTNSSILAQASQAMLAQANQAPQGVLQLLR
jgi:flagellin